ncbi:hypothetical protein [Bowdeniella massiliensis]|uniref:hypothetical protein n=1 Tax=Bowdeniella massiliensis TaxID=2932264 RepID=UPI0020298DE7|nr:hypothetical protein [Bowdeniella massiliensis]
MITDDELDEIQARADAATPGPWVAIGNSVAQEVNQCTCAGHIPCYGHEPYCGLEGPVILQAYPTDATFAAHARTDVPRLTAEIRRLREMYLRRQMLGLEQGSNIEVLTREQAETRRAAILQSIPDEAAFRQQGENFQLNSEDLAKYQQLCNLEWLLTEREES